MKKTLIAGNWKMNLTSVEAQSLAQDIEELAEKSGHEILIIPTFIQIPAVSMHVQKVFIGAQDVYFEKNGAFTGEISIEMLKEFGVTYVLTGHSERRHILGESDELINKKNKALVENEIAPIFCVGETEGQKKQGRTLEVLEEQITQGLKNIDIKKINNIVIAYEPVWAIGTGNTATRDDAEKTMGFIRNVIEQNYGSDASREIAMLYGGSVKPENINEFSNSENIDGVLVGGASLSADSFIAIAQNFKKNES